MKDVSIETGSNYATVKFDSLEVYVSYRTPIAFWTRKTGTVCRVNDWGPTTGKHLNAIQADKSKRIPGAEFERQLAEVLASFGLSD